MEVVVDAASMKTERYEHRDTQSEFRSVVTEVGSKLETLTKSTRAKDPAQSL